LLFHTFNPPFFQIKNYLELKKGQLWKHVADQLKDFRVVKGDQKKLVKQLMLYQEKVHGVEQQQLRLLEEESDREKLEERELYKKILNSQRM
jgi:hypothetical protein